MDITVLALELAVARAALMTIHMPTMTLLLFLATAPTRATVPILARELLP